MSPYIKVEKTEKGSLVFLPIKAVHFVSIFMAARKLKLMLIRIGTRLYHERDQNFQVDDQGLNWSVCGGENRSQKQQKRWDWLKEACEQKMLGKVFNEINFKIMQHRTKRITKLSKANGSPNPPKNDNRLAP